MFLIIHTLPFSSFLSSPQNAPTLFFLVPLLGTQMPLAAFPHLSNSHWQNVVCEHMHLMGA